MAKYKVKEYWSYLNIQNGYKTIKTFNNKKEAIDFINLQKDAQYARNRTVPKLIIEKVFIDE